MATAMKHKKKLVRVAIATGLVSALGLGQLAANASPYEHPTVVTTAPVMSMPLLAETTGQPKPVAYTVAEAGSQMVVGGRFQTVENGNRTVEYTRRNVFAFNAATGAVNADFAPNVDGDVWGTWSDGTSVYIGGAFRNVNGTPRSTLAKLDLATGQLDPNFQPPFRGGRISDIAMVNGQLIVSGTFRARIASLDPDTGKMTTYLDHVVGGRLPNSDSAQVFHFDISPNGQHLIGVGNFLTVDGQERPRVFMLDLGATSTSLSSWNYEPLAPKCTSNRRNAQAYVLDVEFSPDSSWFAFASFGFMWQSGYKGLMLCDSVSRFETANLNPSAPTWINYTGGDSLKSVAVTNQAVYVQGHSRWLDNPDGRDFPGPGAVERPGGGAVDPVTGKALPWNPVMPQQAGGFDILATPTGVWFATDGIRFGGKYRRGIRFAPLP
ncbi:MAG: hypothetical protein ACRDO4_04205 [Nocardioides sp.]